jgi:hypothetical protein
MYTIAWVIILHQNRTQHTWPIRSSYHTTDWTTGESEFDSSIPAEISLFCTTSRLALAPNQQTKKSVPGAPFLWLKLPGEQVEALINISVPSGYECCTATDFHCLTMCKRLVSLDFLAFRRMFAASQFGNAVHFRSPDPRYTVSPVQQYANRAWVHFTFTLSNAPNPGSDRPKSNCMGQGPSLRNQSLLSQSRNS